MTQNKNIQVVEILNALDPSVQEAKTIEYRQGKTLEDIFPSMLMKAEFVFSVNGKIVEDKTLVYPQAGDCIVMCPVLAGGGGSSKSILRIVALIAVAIVAPYIAPAIYGAMGGTLVMANAGLMLSAISAGVMVAGGLLVNAMFPPPKAKNPGAAVNPDDTPTYGIDGPKNASAEGVVVPVVYGRHRYGGNLINAYTTNDGDSQFLHLLYNCGEGPVASITDIQLNDIPIESFRDAQVEVRLGYPDQTPIPWFAQQTVPRNVGQELTMAWIYKETEGEVDQLRFDVTCPSGLYGLYETKTDSYAVEVNIELQYRMVGTQDWLNMGSIADVAEYREETRWLNLAENNVEFNFGNVVPYVPNGQEVRRGDQWFGAPGSPYANSVVGQQVRLPVYNTSFTLSDNKRTAVRRSFFTPALPEAKYELRMRRSNMAGSAPSGKVYIDNCYWSDFNEIVNDPVAYKHTALLGVRVRLTDQLTGLPTVTHMNGGKVLRVWDETTGVWTSRQSSNPAWITLDAQTNKRYGAGMPLARFDMQKWMEWAAHCTAAGLEFNGVFDTQSNIWDALNPVFRCGHAGRTNVGTRQSVVIERVTTPRMMFSVANMIQGTFKQSWLPSTDRANEIDATYIDRDDGYRQKSMRVVDTQAALAGRAPRSTSVTFTGLTSAAEVWRDANILLNQNRLLLQTVEWSSPIEAIACAVGDVVLVQHDMPQWSLAGRLEAGSTSTNLVLDRPVTMDPGLNYAALLHMSVIKRFTGSVTFTQGSGVFLAGFDGATNVKRAKFAGRDVAIESVIQQGNSYGVILASVDGIGPGVSVELWDTDAIESRPVVNLATEAGQVFTELQLAAPLSAAPEQYMQWMFGRNERVGKPFTIRSITGTHDYRRDITAIEYQAGAFQVTPAPPPPNYSDLERFVKHVRITDVDDEVFLIGTTTKSRCTVMYEGQDETYFTAAVYLSRNGGPEERVGEDPRQVTVEASLGDELIFRVVARDQFQRSAPRSTAPTIAHQAQGRTTSPNDATGLTAEVGPGAWTATWDAPTDPDVNASELRIGPSWELGRLLFRGDATSCQFSFLPAGTHELRLRHCIGQTDGLYSDHDCVKTITVLAPLQPIVEGEAEARSISLDWQECVSTQPLKGYSVQVGPNAQELQPLGFTAGRHYQRIEPSPGKRIYWVTAVDVVGNAGAAGYLELETLPAIDDAIAELQEGLDEAVADLLNIGSGLSTRILEEAASRGTSIQHIENLVKEGDEQLAQQIDTLAARAVGYTRGNLVFNGGFEMGLDGWENLHEDWLVEDGPFGRVLANLNALPLAGELQSKALPVSGGAWYVVAADSRATRQGTTVGLGIEFFDDDGASLGVTFGASPLGQHDFSEAPEARIAHTVEVRAPNAAVAARAVWRWNGTAQSEPREMGLRKVKVEQGRLPATAYTSEATDVGGLAALREERTARANGDEAEALARTTLAAQFNESIASVNTEMSAVANSLGQVQAKWGIKVQAGNKVAGITLNNDGDTSDFIVLVDRFAIALPTGAGIKYPFVVGSVGGTPTVGIDGNLVVDGTILTNALAAEVVTADKIKAKSLTAAQIAAGAITADLLAIGMGGNLLADTSWVSRTSFNNAVPVGWNLGANPTAWQIYRTEANFTAWIPPTFRGVTLEQSTGAQGAVMYIESTFPAVAGQRYEASVYVGVHRCNAFVDLHWYNGAGTYLGSSSQLAVVNNQEKAGGQTLADYKRIGCFGTAPTGAAYGLFRVNKSDTISGQANSYAFITCPQVAVAATSQTTFSAYEAAGQGVLITPSGISTPNLSSLSATIGLLRTAASGARTEIESNQIRVYDSNNVLRVRMGQW